MLKLLKWATIGCGHIILTHLELLPPCHTVANILNFCPKINDEACFYVLIKEIMIEYSNARKGIFALKVIKTVDHKN